MVQPINYMAQIPQPNIGASLLSGLQIGAGIQDMQAKRVAAEQAQQAKQQFATDLQAAQANGGQQAWLNMIGKYPQFREAFGDVRKGLGEERVKNQFTSGFDVSTALENQKPEVAKQKLQELIDANRNAGESTGIYQQAFDLIDSGDIKSAQAGINKALSILDPDRFEKTVKAQSTAAKAPSELIDAKAKADKAVADATTAQATATNAAEKAAADAALASANAAKAKVEADFALPLQQAGLNKANWDITNLKSQINDRSERLGLDKQTTAATVAEKLSSIQKNLNELPADTRKLINDAAVNAAASKQSASQFSDLAKRLDAAGGGYGVASSASDFLKKSAGFQGGMTQLRQEYTRLRNSAAIKSLPPGPATDKDIQLIFQGFPGENASATDLASFLRGMAKIQDIDAAVSNAKTDWLASNNGTLTRAKNTFVAGDYAAKPGETFNDFAQRIVGDVSKKYNPTTQTPLVDQIPTPRNPTPNAAQVNIRSAADAILSGGQ
jgi:hypothetical protein